MKTKIHFQMLPCNSLNLVLRIFCGFSIYRYFSTKTNLLKPHEFIVLIIIGECFQIQTATFLLLGYKMRTKREKILRTLSTFLNRCRDDRLQEMVLDFASKIECCEFNISCGIYIFNEALFLKVSNRHFFSLS